ncbi:MAG: sulfatase, partial [Acidobacteriota bacterium]
MRTMIHRMFIIILTVSALALLPVAVQAQPERPNILFIISDDQGWADIGYYGCDVLTPNLDRLAADGIRLEQHYVYPTCSPTRAALIAGRGPSRFGILGPIAGRSEQALPMGIATLPG